MLCRILYIKHSARAYNLHTYLIFQKAPSDASYELSKRRAGEYSLRKMYLK